ncbi:hypothetical protein AOLI_G00275180 [Acnodon oligacanthus]
MFEHLTDVNGIESLMKEEYKFKPRDFLFITELIYGPNPPSKKNCCPTTQDPYNGRPKEKSFLYQIVANHKTGIDVDKMDYFSRDCYHLGMKCNFSYERYMMFAQVCMDEKGEKQICMRDKEAMNMYELFQIRYIIRKNACFHRVTKAVELMLVDAFIAARDFTLGENELTIPEAVMDPETYSNLTDDILQEILRSSDQGLNRAKEIIKRILKRDLYKFIGGKIFDPKELKHLYSDEEWKENEQNKLVAWLDKVRHLAGDQQLTLSPEDFEVVDIKLNYGMKEKNPVDSLLFYRKDNPDIPIQLFKEEVSHLLPVKFSEIKIMLFYKGNNERAVELTKKHVELFWSHILANPMSLRSSFYTSRILNYSGKKCERLQKINEDLQNQELSTSQEIKEAVSREGLYSYVDEKTYLCEDLKHLNTSEERTVLYCLPGKSYTIQAMLFCKRISKKGK